MGKATKIEWCDSTVNPSMGCDGCELGGQHRKTCYAGKLHERRKGQKGFAPTFTEVTEFPGRMAVAAEWSDLAGQPRPDKPWLDGLARCIFISDMSDLLSDEISFEYILDEVIWNVLSDKGAQHRWLWLTKRPRRMKKFSHWLRHEAVVHWPSNLWVGTSITTQKSMTRVKDLLEVGNDHTHHFLSVEPQWEPIQIGDDLERLDWVIQGGESEATDRPFNIARADQLREECDEAGVPYFLKQLGSHAIEDGQRLKLKSRHGVDWDEWPERFRVREMPQATSLLDV